MSLDNSFENLEQFMFPSFEEIQNEDYKEGQYILDPIGLEQQQNPLFQNPLKNGKTYGQLFKIVQRLNDINWVEPYSKITPIKYFTPITFWFIISSQYFQKDIDPKLRQNNIETINYSIEEEFQVDKDKEFHPYTYFDDWWFQELKPKNDLESLQTKIEQQLLETRKELRYQIDAIEIEKPILEIKHQSDFILKDLVGLTEIENQYLTYLESQQKIYDEQIINQSKQFNLAGNARKLQSVYNNCQICNQGTKSLESLLTCQKCQIKVHQKCYGLENVINNWICDLCMNFGSKGKFLKCPLCPKLGGAMRQTTLMMRDSIFEQSNPNYHNYAMNNRVDRQQSPLDGEEEGYNFMILQYSLDNMIGESPKSEKIWAHISCMLWLDFDLLKIDKKKFNCLCNICKTKKNGACIYCAKQKCGIAFHPECARRSQIYMENDEIFCFKHQPLKIKRIFEDQHNLWKEEIYYFFKLYEKLEQYLINKPKNTDLEFQKFQIKVQQEGINADIKLENEQLFQKINEIMEKDEKFIITIEKNQVIDIQYPYKRLSIYDIEEKDRIWQQLTNEKYSTQQIYVLYQRAIRMRKKKKLSNTLSQLQMTNMQELPKRKRHPIYSRPQIFKYHKKLQKLNGSNNFSFKIKIPKEAFNLQYCICKQYINNEEMMQCEICSEWYHLSCLGFLGNIEEAQQLLFYCFKCEQKLTKEQNKYIRRYNQYFSDSTFRELKLKIGMSPHELRAHEKKNYKQLSK